MMKKAGIFSLLVCLLLVLSGAALVQAQGGLAIRDSSVETEFPFKLNFKLSAGSDVNITEIRLHYTVERESYARVTSEAYVEFTPGTEVDVRWDWDMRRTGGLPPGSRVTYWWTVVDANGGRIETTPVQVQFDDNRYVWQSLTEGKVTIYWYDGGQSFAREVMSAAQQALSRLSQDTGAYLQKAVKIYVYADSQDLQGAMIFPQEWTGGVAFTRYGTIAIGIEPSNLSWGKRAIAHELTHLVVQQMTSNPYNNLPSWLNEGLAMYAEGELEPVYRELLNKAIAGGTLISVQSLSSPFSAYAYEASLSYAQSYSLIEFLTANYGQEKMLGLLNNFREGSSYDGALGKAYGFDMDGLDALWRDYVVQQYQKAGVTTTAVSPVLAGILNDLASGFSLGRRLMARSGAGGGWW